MLRAYGLLSGLIIFLASLPYILDIIRGKTRPQRMAWVLFLTLSGISFFAQLAAGATDSLWLAFVLFSQAIIIFILTMFKGMGGARKADVISLIAAILIIVIWVITESAAIAIVCSVLVNTIGKVLVMEKVYHYPDTEYMPTYAWSALASFLAVLSVGEFNWVLILSPLQNGITVGLIAGLIVVRKRRVKLTNRGE